MDGRSWGIHGREGLLLMGKVFTSLPPKPPEPGFKRFMLTDEDREIVRRLFSPPLVAESSPFAWPKSWDIQPREPLKPLSTAEIRRLSY